VFILLDFLLLSPALLLEGDNTGSTTDVCEARDRITVQFLLPERLVLLLDKPLPLIKSLATNLTVLFWCFWWWLKLLRWEWDCKVPIAWQYTSAAIIWKLKRKHLSKTTTLELKIQDQRATMLGRCGAQEMQLIRRFIWIKETANTYLLGRMFNVRKERKKKKKTTLHHNLNHRKETWKMVPFKEIADL